MNKFYALLVILFCLQVSPLALAQWCPPGYVSIGGDHAGWKDCAPLVAPNQPAPDPGPEWETRWGAIAVDSTGGKWGFSDNASSKRKASKSAISSCKESGGKKCKIFAAYYNQCGALASGENRITTYRAPDKDQAEREAVKYCEESTQSCAVIHSGCSYPAKIR